MVAVHILVRAYVCRRSVYMARYISGLLHFGKTEAHCSIFQMYRGFVVCGVYTLHICVVVYKSNVHICIKAPYIHLFTANVSHTTETHCWHMHIYSIYAMHAYAPPYTKHLNDTRTSNIICKSCARAVKSY